jgi:hypothetical protein
MQIDVLVQNPHSIPVNRPVTINGEQVNASLEGFEVSLLMQDGMSGTLNLRYFGKAAAEAKALFVKDAVMTMTIAPKATPAAAPAAA